MRLLKEAILEGIHLPISRFLDCIFMDRASWDVLEDVDNFVFQYCMIEKRLSVKGRWEEYKLRYLEYSPVIDYWSSLNGGQMESKYASGMSILHKDMLLCPVENTDIQCLDFDGLFDLPVGVLFQEPVFLALMIRKFESRNAFLDASACREWLEWKIKDITLLADLRFPSSSSSSRGVQ